MIIAIYSNTQSTSVTIISNKESPLVRLQVLTLVKGRL